MIGQIFAAYIFFYAVYTSIIMYGGAQPSTPHVEEEPLWYFMFLMANAAVYEEIVTRLLFIGIPLFVVALAGGTKGKPLLSSLIGGNQKIGSLAIFLLLFSSIIFGLAHVPSWDIYKVIPSIFAGLCLGYLFLKKGIWASILFHFSIDYFSAVSFLGWRAGNVGILIFVSIAMLVFLATGFFLLLYYVYRTGRFITRSLAKKKEGEVLGKIPAQPPQAASTLVQGPREPQPWFTCPRCGWREARYINGHFQCLKCGYIL